MKTRKLMATACFMMAAVHSAPAAAKDAQAEPSVYVFSYFRGNGETGLHLAYSDDGLNWKTLKDEQSFLKPQIGDNLIRDPSIVQGPDGMFHMVWTVGWWERGIGLAHSNDLIHWSKQSYLPVMKHEPNARNCWAPEIFYDQKTRTYLICWATTITGRFQETANPHSDKRNHRMYCITTQDFKTFTETALFYDPGFNVIDTFIIHDEKNDRYAMFLKNETDYPEREKNIRIAFSDRAAGPYGPASEPITGDYWAEGPAALKVGDRWIVYFDKYIKHEYGAVASCDLEKWEDISDQVRFPKGARHGTAFAVSPAVLEKLKAVRPDKNAEPAEQSN